VRWATLNLNKMVISIQTNDPSYGGTHYLVLHVTTNGDSTATPVDVVYQVTIDICSNIVIQVTSAISDFEYSTLQGEKTVPTPFSSPAAQCPLERLFKATETSAKPYNTAIFTFISESGALTLNTNNMVYAGHVFRVQLSARVVGYPATEKVVLFYITIVNGCETVTILPPSQIDNDPFAYILWSSAFYKFNYGSFEPANINRQSQYNCGFFRYELVDATTEEIIDTTVFSLDVSSSLSMKLRGLVAKREPWLTRSPHKFKIRTILGANYQRVNSAPFTVVVTDPCLTTKLIPISLGPYVVAINDGIKQFIIAQIQDSVSQQFSSTYGDGSGYDLCGYRTYELSEVVNS